MSDPAAPTPEQRARLVEARAAYRSVTRPAGVAAFNGWTLGAFGAATVAWGVLAGGSGVGVGIALVALAWNELRGARRLRAADPDGARILAWNQLWVGAVIGIYCLRAIRGAAPDASLQEMESLAGLPAGFVADLTRWVYGGVALVVALVQTLLARWYLASGRRAARLRETTEPWVIDLMQN